MVGVRGFEPPAPASRTQCSTRLSYTPTHETGQLAPVGNFWARGYIQRLQARGKPRRDGGPRVAWSNRKSCGFRAFAAILGTQVQIVCRHLQATAEGACS